MRIIGTRGAENLAQTSATGVMLGLGGSDTLNTTVSGVPTAVTTQDGGAGNDTLTVAIVSDTSTGTGPALADNSQIGGYGKDVFNADTTATAAADAFATNKITDLSGASTVTTRAVATGPSLATSTFPIPTAYASNIVETGASKDQITAGAYSDFVATNFLRSGRGNDFIRADAKLFYGHSSQTAANYIFAGAGADTINSYTDIGDGYGSRNNNTKIDAGSGDDVVVISASSFGEYTNTSIVADGGANDDTISATVAGGALEVSDVDVVLVGGAGNDSVSSSIDANGYDGYVAVSLDGGGGSDNLFADTRNVSGVDGGAYHVLDGGAGHDTLTSHIEVPFILDGRADVQLVGSFGNDELTSTVITGLDGVHTTQTLAGDGGNDKLCATTTIEGNAFNAANGSLAHSLFGGSGFDTLRSEIDTTAAGTTHNLNGGTGSDVIAAIGGSGMTVHGGAGHDTIISSASSGTIDAGDGDDVIDADGSGNKYLTGGAGADRFHVNAGADQGYRAFVDWDGSEDILLFENITDISGNNEIWDEINAQIASVSIAGGNLNITLVGGSVLDFVNTASQLSGPTNDIRSYVDDPTTQILSGADLVPPIC